MRAPLLLALLACLLFGHVAAAQGVPAFVSDAQSGSTPALVTGDDAEDQSDSPDAPQAKFSEDESKDFEDQGFGLAASYLSPAGERSRLKYTGTGTTSYEDIPLDSFGAVGFGCGLGYVGEAFRAAYVGIGSTFYNKGLSCGRCIEVQCDDESCQEVGRRRIAMVLDSCGNCLQGDLAMAQPLYQNLTGNDPNLNPTSQVSWQLVDCGDLVNGSIKMLVKPGGNAYFQAFNFANSKPITAVQVNGDRLKHSTSNFWEWNPGAAIQPQGPFNIALLASNRQVLRVRIKQLRSQDLQVQFRGGGGGGAAAAPAPPSKAAAAKSAPAKAQPTDALPAKAPPAKVEEDAKTAG